jgi:hypothetical protein
MKQSFQVNRLTTRFLVPLCGLATIAESAPKLDVDAASYTQNSEVLIIEGSGFAQAPNVVLFENFENGVPGTAVNRSGPVIGQWTNTFNDPLYVRDSEGNTAFSIRNFDPTKGGKIAQLQLVLQQYYKEIFYSFSVKVPESNYFAGAAVPETFPDYSTWKFSWLYSGERGFGQEELFDLAVPTHSGRGSFMVGGNSGTLSYINDGVDWWAWNSFNHFSFYMKIADDASSTDNIDWFLMTTSPKNFLTKSGSESSSSNSFQGTDYRFNHLNFPGWWGNGTTENFNAIYDNVYVAVGENANARVVITDKAEVTSSTKNVTIPAISWTDQEIRLNVSHFPSWPEVYIHVVDSDGNFSENSFNICLKCPSKIKPSID